MRLLQTRFDSYPLRCPLCVAELEIRAPEAEAVVRELIVMNRNAREPKKVRVLSPAKARDS